MRSACESGDFCETGNSGGTRHSGDSGESGDSDEFCQNQVNLMILVWSGFWNMAGNVEIWWEL